MPTSPVIFEAQAFVATAQELLDIAAQNIYNTYPPYNLDIYNTYIQQTSIPPPPPFVPRPIPQPISSSQSINTYVANVENQIEGDFLSFSNNNCDIFATDLEYDLDINSIQDSQIVLDPDPRWGLTPFNANISGIWRPFFLYIDSQNSSVKNTRLTRSASAQENPYEAGLVWENFITITNPTLKNWTLSGGSQFRVNWRIPKENFLTNSVLGLLFWYRYYDMGRENNIKATFEITEYSETVQNTAISPATLNNVNYAGQHEYHQYTTTSSSNNIERYGLHSGLNAGDKVIIKESNQDEYIYEVTDNYWINLGKKRFMPGIDMYIPEDQFSVFFGSSYDREDWNQKGQKPEEVDVFTYPKTSLVTKDMDRYSNILNKLLNFENNIGLQNLFNQSGSSGDSTGGSSNSGDDSASFEAGIYTDSQLQLDYLAIKNLARFLTTAPVAATEHIRATDITLDNLNLKNFNSIYSLRTDLENIFGYNQVDAITQAKGDIPLLPAASNTPSIMTQTYTANIKAQNALTHSFTNNLVNTKKDLLMALFKTNKQNRYIEFPKGMKTKLVSKFAVKEPHMRILLDFQDMKALGSNSSDMRGLWYKQRINAAGLDLFTRLKFPDASVLQPNEREALVLKYIDSQGQDKGKTEINIAMSQDFVDSSNDYYNQVINSVYEKFGIAKLFQQKYNLENNILAGDNNGQYYDVLLTNNRGDNLKVYKNTTYQENQTFDNSVRFFKSSIDEYASTNDKFDKTMRLVEQRFSDRISSQQGIFPNIKELYLHRIGGFYLPTSSFLTVGRNKFFRARTAPVNMSKQQYFLDTGIRNDMAIRPENRRNVTIEFDCGSSTTVELYGINITKLRDDTLENANCRPFPNKIPVDGDEVSVYSAVVGYDFNESSHILSTQFAPPILAYGGHRADDISALGLKILDHPSPIASGENGQYTVASGNILPQAAKSSFYYNRNQSELDREASQLGLGTRRDKSLVKCFLTPTDFANEVTFRKGFFHPNKGWIDYTLLPSELQQKTAVKSILDSPCRQYIGTGALFREVEITKADDQLKASSPIKTGKDYSIIIRDPMEIYMDGERGFLAFPNILTVDIDPKTDFITHMAVTLKNLTHPAPKELKVALFDSLEYRWIGFNCVKATLDRMAATYKGEDENYVKKIQKQIAQERNAWLGPWSNQQRSNPRHVMFHSSFLNYGSNFNGIFTNASRRVSNYAFSNDFILPSQSLDYYIGTSGVYGGFWDYDGPIPTSNSSSDPESLPTQQEPFIGDPSNELAYKWGIQISDMGAEDEGGACFDLQVCTGCPVPGYTQSYIYNRFLYNNDTFDIAYPSGYNFIANFRNKQHLLPPVNLDAPYSTINPEYPKQDVGVNYPVQLGCIAQPDPPRPREMPVEELKPEPVFLPPFHPSIVGLLTYMAAAETLQAAGYGWDLGFLTGVFFPSPFYFGATRREKLNRYMENKGYLQIEGSTEAAKQLTGFQVKNIGLYDDSPFGQADKIQLEVKHPNGLWYNVEADIFKYSSYSSPVLENTKFNYLKYTKFHESGVPLDTKYTKPLNYPAFDFHIDSLRDNRTLVIDGVRAYYSFMKNEPIELNYKVIDTTIRQDDGTGPCVQCYDSYTIYSRKITKKINNIYIEDESNPFYIKTELMIQDPSSIEANLGPPDSLYPDDQLDENPNPDRIRSAKVVIELDSSIEFASNEKFVEGVIYKGEGSSCSSFLLFDPIITGGKISPTGNVNYKRGADDTATPKMYPVLSSISNTFDVLNFGKWSNVRDRNLGAFTSSYPFDQLYAEGGLGWGTNLIKPESIPVIGNKEKYLTLLDLDYHITKTNYCGNIKFTKSYDEEDTHIGYVKFNPRLTYKDMPKHPYSYSKENEFISFTGYPRPLDIIPNRIYAHNVLSISEQNASILNMDSKEMHKKYRYNPEILDYYLPFYDLTLDNTILDEELTSSTPITPGSLSSASGVIQLENIFTNNNKIIYDNNYYWISVPMNASGVISGSSKIPVAVIQRCYHSKGTFSYCANMCNTEGRGPVWPNMDNTSGSSTESIYRLPSENAARADGVVYEERQTSQTYYVGCGEIRNDSLVRMDVIQIYEVPEQSNTYVPVSELMASNEITVRFKYLPRKIPTDFKVTLGNNIVNQSQLYLWECHKTNPYNVYNTSTVTNTPPFYQILNEMIFRAWFGERQKIALEDTYDEKLYITQNHYKWVPYDYDDTDRFSNERNL